MASVAGRYASALFDLAIEERKLAEVEQDVMLLQDLLDESEDFRRMVRSPVFSADEQGRAMAAVAQRAGVSALGINFVRLLARGRRLFALSDILKAFRQMIARHRGEVTAEVTVAEPLSDAHFGAIKDALKSATGGQNVDLQAKLDNLKTRMKEVR
jgi:F-type H+-transporting ATPase subunit delta